MNAVQEVTSEAIANKSSSLNRWVDEVSARAVVLLVLQSRVSQRDGYISNVPEEVLTQQIPRFLHFDNPICGMIYVFGGRASKVLEPEHYLNTAECYDTFRREWIQLPPMMTKRVGASSIVGIDGRVYIIGGYAKHPDKPLSSGECFDPRTGEWKAIADLSQGRFGHSIAVCGKYLFVIGGDSRRNLVSGIERYDIEADVWKTVGLLPRPVAGGRTLERNGKLYLIGGDIGSQPLSFTSTIRVYEPSTNTWTVLDNELTQGRSATACTWLSEGSSEIAVIGGYAADNDSFFELKTSEIVQTDLHGNSVSCGRSIPPLPEARAGCRAVTIGHKIYVVGGETPEPLQPMARTDMITPLPATSAPWNPEVAGHRPLVNVREILLQALQQRLSSSHRSSAAVGEDTAALLLPPPTRLTVNSQPTERRAHPVVAIFDSKAWAWEKDTPCMTTPRTAASVCVGVGYPSSFGWMRPARWVTEKHMSLQSCGDVSMSPTRPLAASG